MHDKITKLYRKWNFILFRNNLIYLNKQIYLKRIVFLKRDLYKHLDWLYQSKTTLVKNYVKHIFKHFYI
jgi:hypothetical protein